MTAAFLNYDWRAGRGVPLVLLHEMGGSLHSWDLVMRRLPADRAVLRVDLRGFGLSEKPSDPLLLRDMAEDVLDLMRRLRLGPAQVCGCAVGAAVAIAMAAEDPAAVASLILLAPATGVPEERRAGLQALAARFRVEGVRSFLEQDTFPSGWPEDRIPRGEGFDLFRRIQLGTSPESLARCYEMLAGIDLGPVLERLACPITIAAGRHDMMRPPDRMRALARDRADFVEITDAGHFMPLQAPQAIADLLAAQGARRQVTAGA